MSELMGLWLPILVSAVVVFFASFLAWMVLPFHKADWKGLPDEAGFFAALRSGNVPPGQYIFPFCSDPAKMKDPAYKKTWEAGPHGHVRIAARAPNFGRNLLLVFLFYVLTGIFVGYIAAVAIEPGASFPLVLRVTGTASILAYSFAIIPGAIFFGVRLKSLALDVADGVVYGVLTGIVFALMWPDAAATLPIG